MRRRRFWLRAVLLGVAAVLLLGLAAVWWLLPGTYRIAHDWELPTRYDADRFYAEPTAANGVRLSLLTDTGGGLFLTRRALQRAGAENSTLAGLNRARLPSFTPGAAIPEPTGGERWMPVSDRTDSDGMLGQRWFAGGVWTFDYPAGRLILHAQPFAPTASMLSHMTPLGFRTVAGVRVGNHPRFTATMDGEPVQCLFDTGATAFLTPQALAILHDGGASERATSFVADSLFTRWRKRHPGWRFIENGCGMSHQPMIEVPQIQAAGLRAGPVWFTRRPDEAMRWMSSFLDQPISASIGGNFLRHFRITLDYPNARAYFAVQGPP